VAAVEAVAVATDQELLLLEARAKKARPIDQRPADAEREDTASTLARLVRRLIHSTESLALVLARRT